MNRTVLVTGVSRPTGLGLEVARQLVQQGCRVIVTARQISEVSALTAGETNFFPMEVDVSNDESVAQLAMQVGKELGGLDVLVNNAGSFFDQGVQPLSTEMDFALQAFDTNLLGAWRMAKAFVPLLSKSVDGRIVNVSSGAGSFEDPIFGLSHHQGIVPTYGLTKLALNGLTVKLARQLEAMSIKVNSVCPGFVATYPGTEQWGARPVAEGAKGIVWAVLEQNIPSGKFFRDGKLLPW